MRGGEVREQDGKQVVRVSTLREQADKEDCGSGDCHGHRSPGARFVGHPAFPFVMMLVIHAASCKDFAPVHAHPLLPSFIVIDSISMQIKLGKNFQMQE